MKKCSVCEEVKPLSKFAKNNKSNDGYTCLCKKCIGLKREFGTVDKIKDKLMSDELDKHCGGYKIYILNHVKEGEHKYNIVSTIGETWNYNSKEMFMDKLNEILKAS